MLLGYYFVLFSFKMFALLPNTAKSHAGKERPLSQCCLSAFDVQTATAATFTCLAPASRKFLTMIGTAGVNVKRRRLIFTVVECGLEKKTTWWSARHRKNALEAGGSTGPVVWTSKETCLVCHMLFQWLQVILF
jgi:hypothetical protein